MSSSAENRAVLDEWGPVVVDRMELSPPSLLFHQTSLLGIGLGAILCAIGVMMVAVDNPIGRLLALLALPLYDLESVRAGVFMTAAGLLLIVLGRRTLAPSAAQGGTLTVYERGLVVSRQGREQRIAYDEVQSLVSYTQRAHLQGQHAETLYQLDFAGKEERTRLVHCIKASEDTFSPVLDEILHQLADEVEVRLKRGGELRGEGWTLDSRGLHLGRQGTVSMDALADVNVFEDALCLWRKGESLPFFSISATGPNVRLLDALARRRFEGRAGDLGPLGRVVFRLKMSTAHKVLRWMFVATLLILTFCSAFLGGPPGMGFFFFALIAVLVASFFLADCFRELRVHELGVSQKFIHSRGLLYSDIQTFSFGEIRKYLQGISPAQSTVRLRMTSGPGGETLAYAVGTGHRPTDAALESVCGMLTEVVAHRMLSRLKRGEDVPWGDFARFTRRGLCVRRTNASGQLEERLIPYETPMHESTEQGVFYLYVAPKSEAWPILSVERGEDNFYPGLKVLELLRSSAAQDFWDPARELPHGADERWTVDVPARPPPRRLRP